MKKETRYDMLTHIDPKYIDEAFPKKRNIASAVIPIAACICAVALIVPAVVYLHPLSAEKADQGISLQSFTPEQEYALDKNEETHPQATTGTQDQITEPSAEAENDGDYAVWTEGCYPLAEPIELTPIIIDDPERDAYLNSYTTLSIGGDEVNSSNGSFAEIPKPQTENITFTWNDMVNFYGKDVRPLYLPNTLIGTDLESCEYNVKRVTEDNEYYKVGDYLGTMIIMKYYENPDNDYSPTNRGVRITVSKTSYTDVTETERYRMTPNAENSISYYDGTPILFYVRSDQWSTSLMEGSEAITEIKDVHMTQEYQSLLEEFITKKSKEGKDFQKDGWLGQDMREWDEYLKANGIPDGEPILHRNFYNAILIHEGIKYTLESNLDFETFAAITASLIHD